jgi:6-pyruvoyltetrahydropterin/6-carboxytetrahydropterin synthase
MGKFISTKTYTAERGFAVAYRQWRAESHCNLIHGYSMGFHFEFECDDTDLDARNWVVDFGSLKTLKYNLDDWFDHTCLVAQDDPEFALFEQMHQKKLIKMVVVERTGCEGLAKFLADYINDIWLQENGYADRVKLRKVEVRETPSNSAMWISGE